MHPANSSQPDTTLDVLIVANFASTDGTGNCRFNDLASRLLALGANVELVTSNFNHTSHSHRQIADHSEGHKITLVQEPGYRKNISIKRLLSQRQFGQNVRKYLKSRQSLPDLIYCATPPPDVARICAEYSQQHNIPFVVDVQDLWPEAFGMKLDVPWIIDLLFRPMIQSSKIGYVQADLVVGVSRTYVDHAEKIAGTPLSSSVVFLGTKLDDDVQEASQKRSFGAQKITKIIYAGTLSHSYNLTLVMDAMASLRQADPRFTDLEFTVLGDGPRLDEFQKYAEQKGIAAHFLGRLPYADMQRQLRAADIAVNPIAAGSLGSIINKVGDYASAGLPVVNTQESSEYRQLLERYQAGVNCENGSISDVAAAIQNLVDNPALRMKMGHNNRRMAEELFDRDKTYDELAQKIMGLALEAPHSKPEGSN